ncbi:hypothetical protein [Chromohalobacter sp. 296-RDG]|uniref:hypothetical protein n=1 Tax=Chromohalobacter sp. 296-RDG TaxID=2994062 RepID=UPI0024682EA5|nr:hypothetical protein [Chromohalobacter sp. 296-RDG]
MSSRELIKRLDALESQRGGDDASVRHVILVPASHGPEPLPVTGYATKGVETHRRDGESVEACWQRHHGALDADGQDGVTISEQLTEDD